MNGGQPGTRPSRDPIPCLLNADNDEILPHLKAGQFFWLDLESPSDDKLETLAHTLHLHPLTVEDARTFKQRPQFEEYPGYVFLVVYGVDPGPGDTEDLLAEVHVIVSGEYVVTIHRAPLAPLAELRERYSGLRMRSEQFLVYKILDAVTETFFPVLSRIDDAIDGIEEGMISRPTDEYLRKIFALKRDLIAMRRVITPSRDVFAREGERIAELPGLEADDRLYFRDLFDTLIRASDLVDSYRDLLNGVTDMYLSTIANRQGEVNKQLTIIATIFLPLTFLTGFFGQNFAFLTNHILETTWSYVVLGLGSLLVSVIVLILFFRRKRWL